MYSDQLKVAIEFILADHGANGGGSSAATSSVAQTSDVASIVVCALLALLAVVGLFILANRKLFSLGSLKQSVSENSALSKTLVGFGYFAAGAILVASSLFGVKQFMSVNSALAASDDPQKIYAVVDDETQTVYVENSAL